MPTILKLALDAEEYKRDLEAVIAETRAAAQALGETQAKLQVTADTEQAKSELSDLPQVQDQHLTVTADTEQAKADLSDLPQVQDQQLTITADTEQAEEAIAEINDAEIPDKPVQIRLTNAREVMRQLEETGRVADMAGTDIARSFSKAGGAVASVSAALGGINPQISVIAQGISALAGGPVTIAIAAAGALIAVMAKLYDTLTVSAEEYAAQCDVISVKVEETKQKFAEYDQAVGKMVSHLNELNAADQTGLSVKRATAEILSTLQSRYGDLGARIDETTGKVLNLAEVEARVNRERAREKAGILEAEADSSGSQAEAAYMKVKGAEWGTTEIGARGIFRTMRRTMSLDDLIEEMEKESRDASSAEDKRGYGEVAKHLRAERKKREEAAEFRKSGYGSAEEAISARTQKELEAEAAKKTLRETKRANHVAEMERDYQKLPMAEWKAQNRLQLANEEADLRDMARAKEARLWGELDSAKKSWDINPQAAAEKIAELERQIAQAAKEAEEAEGRRAGYWAQYEEVLNATSREFTRQRGDLQQQIDYNQLLIDGKYEEAEATKLRNDFLDKGLSLTKSHLDILLALRRQRQGQESRKRIQDAEAELRIQRLILAGKYEEAEAAKLEAEARRAGRKLSPEEKQARLAATEEGKQLKLQKSLYDQADALLGQAMQAAGRGREYNEGKALRDAETQKGGALTGEEKRNVRRLFTLTERLNDLQNEPGVRGMTDVKTNALTARGGFSGAVRLPDTEQYNREIAQSGKRQAELLKEIKGICEKLGKF